MHRSHLPSCDLCRDAVGSHGIAGSFGDYKPFSQTGFTLYWSLAETTRDGKIIVVVG